MIEPHDIPIVTDMAASAMLRSWEEYARGDIASEDRLTEAIATRLRDTITEVVLPSGHAFAVRALQSSAGRYGTAEETRFGADFMVALQVRSERYRMCVGWIAQAKVRRKLRRSAWQALQRQCQAMERELPGNGWAVLYGPRTKVIRAALIAGLVSATDAPSIPSRTWRIHFERFFKGEFGDSRACDLLKAAFVTRRREEFGIPLVVLDLFYGDLDDLAEWRTAQRPALVSISRSSEVHPDGEESNGLG